jgi:hypothetical protein
MEKIFTKHSKLFLELATGETVRVVTRAEAIKEHGISRGKVYHNGNVKNDFRIFDRDGNIFIDLKQLRNFVKQRKDIKS